MKRRSPFVDETAGSLMVWPELEQARSAISYYPIRKLVSGWREGSRQFGETYLLALRRPGGQLHALTNHPRFPIITT